jgi:hypothetical protein
MRRNFNEIMGELTSLLKQGEDDPQLTGGGPDVVNSEKGEIGSSTTKIPGEAKGDVSLRLPHKDGDTLTYDKENAYPDRQRNPDSSSQELPKSMIGDDNMGLEDAPAEKKAAFRAQRLLNSIDFLLSDNLDKRASANLQRSMDTMALQKAASFEAGRAAAREWSDYITKFAEEAGGGSGPLDNSKEHRGDLADTAVGRLVPMTDPHNISDNKSPEAEPSTRGDKKAPALMQGNDHVDDTLEAKAAVAMIKAQLYDELYKAAAAQDEAALAIAKANIVDFLNGEL